MERLQRLTEQPQLPAAEGEAESGQGRSSVKRKQRERAAVLHDAADELQRLRAEVSELRAGEEAQRRRVDELSSAACLCQMDGRRSLHALALLRSRMCLLLMSQRGVVLDVSERVVELTGWQRRQLQGSAIGRYDAPPKPSEVCPLWVRVVQQQPHAAPSLHFLPQYPASKQQLSRLSSGAVHRVEMAFRMWNVSGRTFEAACTAWHVDFGETDERGQLRGHCVVAWALDDSQPLPSSTTLPTGLPLTFSPCHRPAMPSLTPCFARYT